MRARSIPRVPKDLRARALDNSLVGSPDDIVERVQLYADAGVNHMECKFLCRDLDNFVEMLNLYAEDVLPNFKK